MSGVTEQKDTKRTPQLMRLSAAAEFLGVPRTTLRDLVAQGHVPHVHLGDSRRIWLRRADVEALIARCLETA